MMLYRVLKLVRLTVKKEAGKVVENVWESLSKSSGVSKSFGREPLESKKGPERVQNFEF